MAEPFGQLFAVDHGFGGHGARSRTGFEPRARLADALSIAVVRASGCGPRSTFMFLPFGTLAIFIGRHSIASLLRIV